MSQGRFQRKINRETVTKLEQHQQLVFVLRGACNGYKQYSYKSPNLWGKSFIQKNMSTPQWWMYPCGISINILLKMHILNVVYK